VRDWLKTSITSPYVGNASDILAGGFLLYSNWEFKMNEVLHYFETAEVAAMPVKMGAW
jgi:hypothetical protein